MAKITTFVISLSRRSSKTTSCPYIFLVTAATTAEQWHQQSDYKDRKTGKETGNLEEECF